MPSLTINQHKKKVQAQSTADMHAISVITYLGMHVIIPTTSGCSGVDFKRCSVAPWTLVQCL